MDDEIWGTPNDFGNSLLQGGVSLEWMQEAGPTKFLVGSEHGIILSCTKRPKKQVGMMPLAVDGGTRDH